MSVIRDAYSTGIGKIIAGVIALIAFLVAFSIVLSFRERVDAGMAAVVVNSSGDRGIQNEVLVAGRYWVPWWKDLYPFPVRQQTVEASISFNDNKGNQVTAPIAIKYTLSAGTLARTFKQFRTTDEIAISLKNEISDSFNRRASKMEVAKIYGDDKAALLDAVKIDLARRVALFGIEIGGIAYTGRMGLDAKVQSAIAAGTEAVAIGIRIQNEVEQKKAEANKAIAQAEGEKAVAIKQAEGIAESLRLRSEAEAKANDLIGASIARNPKLIEYNVAKKWNGETPKVTGSGGMIVQVPPVN